MNNASFGAYAAVVQSPAYRDDKVRTTLDLLPDLLARRSGPLLRVQAGDVRLAGPQAVLVSNNPYGGDDLAGLGRRVRLDAGELGLLAVTVERTADAVDLARGLRSRAIRRTTCAEVDGRQRRGRAAGGRRRRGVDADDAGAVLRAPGSAAGPCTAGASRGPGRAAEAGVDRRGPPRPGDVPVGDPVNAGTDAPPVAIAHLSDLHFGAHDPASAESLLGDVAAFRPTVTVVTGDLTQRARHREFSAAVAFLDRLPSPRLVVLGNHDVPLDRLQRVTDPYGRYREHVRPDLDPVLDADGVRVLGLQSMPRWRWKSGRVSRRQTNSVVSILGAPEAAEGPRRPLRVVALHHPVSPTGAATLVGRSRLLAALAQARVELVLAGHTHVPSLTWLELPDETGSWCVLQGVAGTATSTRLRGAPRSWTSYRIDAATITVEERFESDGRWATAGERQFRRPSDAGSPRYGGRGDRLPT